MTVSNLLDTSAGDLVAERPDRARVFDRLKMTIAAAGVGRCGKPLR
jgi:hypothetical protein